MVVQNAMRIIGGMNCGMKKNKPFFSIVTPTFNRADYLSQLIEGVLSQTYKNWEHIIVNDGGTDSSPDLIHWYQKKNKNIRYFERKKNMGIGFTRNEGNSYAKGKWIVVADSDDIWLPNRLEILYRYINLDDKKIKLLFPTPHLGLLKNFCNPWEKVDLIYGGMLWMGREGRAVRQYWKPTSLTAEKLRKGNQVIIHGACAYRKWVADKIGYRNEQRKNDDFWFVVDCWNSKVKFGFVNQPLMGYRILEDGVSRVNYQSIRREMKRKLKYEKIKDRI